MGGWPSWLMTLVVALAAAFSFSPRAYPPAPETRVHPQDLLVTGLARRGDRWIAVGEQGRVLLASQTGGEWREARVEPQRGSNLNAVLVVDERVVLAAGHESWLLRSEDGGESWKEVLFDAERSEPLLALAGPYDGRVFAIGGFGQYLLSDDAGRSWTRATHEALADYHLNGLTQLGDGSLLIVGERGLLARSTNKGASWTRLPEVYTGSFFGVLALGERGALAYGMRGNVFRSEDGVNWTRAQVPGAISLFGGVREDADSIVLVGENDSLLRSADGGASFQLISARDRGRLNAVLPREGDAGWVVAGENGIALRDAASAP